MNNSNNIVQGANSVTQDNNLINLLNFDPTSKNAKFLNSPRSIEACRRLCFDERELLIKNAEDFKNEIIPDEFADDKDFYIQLKVEHYEKRRQEKIKQLIEERKKIMNEQLQSMNNSRSQPNIGTGDKFESKSSYLSPESEKKIIEQLKNKQKKEIEFIVFNEMRLAEIKKKNEDKLKKFKEIEEKRQEELEIKRKINDEAKKKRELKMKMKEQEIEQQNIEVQMRLQLEEQTRKEKLEELELKRKQESKSKETKRKTKALLLEAKINQFEVDRRKEGELQKKIREEKYEKLKELIMERQLEKKKENEATRQKFLEKIQVTKENQEKEIEEQRQKLIEKQNQKNSIKEKLDLDKKIELDERRKQSELRLLEIKKALEQKFEEEQAKKESYLIRYKIADENREKYEKERDKSIQEKIRKEIEREERLKTNLSTQNIQMEQKNKQLLQSIEEEQIKVDQRRNENLKKIKKKYITEIFRLQDTMENNSRLEKVRELKKKQVIDKVQLEEYRFIKIQQEKESAITERKKMQERLEHEKLQILQEFEKKKEMLNNGQMIDFPTITNSFDDRDNYSPSKIFGKRNRPNLTLSSSSIKRHTQSSSNLIGTISNGANFSNLNSAENKLKHFINQGHSEAKSFNNDDFKNLSDMKINSARPKLIPLNDSQSSSNPNNKLLRDNPSPNLPTKDSTKNTQSTKDIRIRMNGEKSDLRIKRLSYANKDLIAVNQSTNSKISQILDSTSRTKRSSRYELTPKNFDVYFEKNRHSKSISHVKMHIEDLKDNFYEKEVKKLRVKQNNQFLIILNDEIRREKAGIGTEESQPLFGNLIQALKYISN